VAAILAVMTLVFLAGCVKVDVALSVHDDVVDGTMLMAVDKRLAAATGQSQETILDSITQNAPSGEGVTSERYEDDTYVGMRFVLDGVPISNLNQDRSGLTLTHDNGAGTYVASGTLDLGALDPQGFATSGLAASFDVRFSVTFPGRVTTHNGQLDGTTVTWVATPGQTLDVTAVAEDSEPFPWILISAIGIPVVLIIAGAAMWLVSRRPRPDGPADASATPAEPTNAAESAAKPEPVPRPERATEPESVEPEARPTGEPVSQQEVGRSQS
jgi:hypothetical protein